MADQGETVVLILGGYGNTGRRLTRILTRRTEATVVVAGRDELRARRLADELNRKLGEERVLARVVDAARPGTLRDALGDVELLIVASSTARHAEGVARAALETGTDYVDVHYGSRKTRALRAMAAEVEAAGLCFMTDAGFHPGLPAVLVRHVGVSFERLETARVAAAMKVDWRGLDLAVETTREFVEMVFAETGHEPRLSVAPKALFKAIGLFNPYVKYDKCPGLPGEPCDGDGIKQATSELCLSCSAKKTARAQFGTRPINLELHRILKVAIAMEFDIATLMLLCQLKMPPTWEELANPFLDGQSIGRPK